MRYVMAFLILLLAIPLVAQDDAPGGGTGEFSYVSSENTQLLLYNMLTAETQVLFEVESGNILAPVWSMDGMRLVYRLSGSESDGIYIYDVASDETVQITESGNDYGAVFSPDGQSIAYSSPDHIVVYDLIIDIAKDITMPDEGSYYSPIFTPDGDSMLFVEVSADGRPLVQYIDGEIEVFFDEVEVAWPQYDFAGERLVFIGRPNNATGESWNVYMLDEDGLTQITEEGGEFTRPSWSPDGEYLLYQREGVIILNELNGDGEIFPGIEGYNPAWRPLLEEEDE